MNAYPGYSLPRMESKSLSVSQRRQQQIKQKKADRVTRFLKQGIWAYFLLLIFEGALRKWFLPGLATPLLVVRDPIALAIVITAWRHHLIPANLYTIGVIIIGIVGILTALAFGHGNLLVALFGARIILLHFPLIFVIGHTFMPDDVIKVGKVILWMVAPMTVLIALQFYSPQSDWVNLGVGGDTAGAGFSGANGYFRPPAVFTFTSGTTLFYSFATCYIFYFWLSSEPINRLLLIGATVGLLAAIPLSISRALFFQVGVAMLFTVIAVSRKPKYAWKMGIAVAGLTITLTILSKLTFFQTATEAFTARFEGANEAGGGVKGAIVDRFLDGIISALESTPGVPFFGYGLGMGTNVGSQLLTGQVFFLISEGEWGRIIGELGPIMGILIVFLRIGLTIQFILASYSRLVEGSLLPWMILSHGITMVSQGGWGQPTSLGFCVFIGGLLAASLKTSSTEYSL